MWGEVATQPPNHQEQMLRERCQVTTSFDDKGRVGLPAKLRHKLVAEGIGELVATCFDVGSIRLYDEAHFRDHVEGRIAGQDPDDPVVEDYIHAVLAGAESCTLDKQGRVRIPQRLREEASIDRELVLISVMDRIELWDPEAWAKRVAEARSGRRRRRGT
jgi:MraZ protein